MKVIFNCRTQLHQTVYLKSPTLSLEQTGLQSDGWVWHVIQTVAATSLHKQMQESQVRLVIRTLREVAQDMRWCACADIHPTKVTLETGIQTLEALDDAVDQLPLQTAQKSRRASRLRLWLQQGLAIIGVPRAERVAVQYRSRFITGRGQPRKLLSDEKSSSNWPAEYPLGALPHTNIADLVEKERSKREGDLMRVEAAAITEIKEHEARFLLYRKLLADHPTVDMIKLEKEINFSRKQVPKWLRAAPPADVAASYFRLLNDSEFWARRLGPKLKVPGSLVVFDYLEEQLNQQIPRYRLIEHFVCTLGTQQVLTACLLLIQAYTGWNVNSVLEMNRDMVNGDSPRYTLQGYKRRIDQLTPIVEVTDGGTGVRLAVDFILRRHSWLVSRGWISSNEHRLWLNPVSIQNDPNPKAYVGWGSSLHRFCQKHGLQHFSFEQIRVQKLSLISLSSAGAKGAQEVAGHLHFSTTGHYLEQEVLTRLRSAMSFEFQRRLESVIHFDFSVQTKKNTHAYLLKDIGDGASCRSPQSPPGLSDLVDGECLAVSCHVGEYGCRNRVIRVDAKSLESAVRLRNFYISNWSRMVIDNWKAFEKIHLARLIFNQMLLAVVGRSPHRGKLAAINDRISKEER